MIRINLLSVKEAEQALGRRNQLALAILGVLVMAVCMVVPYMVQRTRMATLTRETEDVQREVMRYNEQAKEVEELKKIKEELTTKLQIIQDLEDKRSGPARVLVALSSSAPEKLWIKDFSEVSGSVTIVGVALDNETVANFMRQLKSSPYFPSVDLDESASLGTTKITGGTGNADFKRFVVKARVDYLGRRGVSPTPAAAEDGKTPRKAGAPAKETAGKAGASR